MTAGFRVGLALVAVVFVVGVSSAEAVTFKFADPGALSPNGTPDACFNGDDVCGPTLSWTHSGITVTASPLGSATAIQDLYPSRAGLGAVYHDGGGGYSDHRGQRGQPGQGIRLTFSEPVLLGRVRSGTRTTKAISASTRTTMTTTRTPRSASGATTEHGTRESSRASSTSEGSSARSFDFKYGL
jgi:hypothetical protein